MSQGQRARPKLERTQAYCNECGRLTNHNMIAVDRHEYDDDAGDKIVACFDNHEMLKCRGCGSIAMRITIKHLEDTEQRVLYYPPTLARRAPSWVAGSFDSLKLPTLVFDLMNEVYTAVQNGLLRLAAMGVRATLENVMTAKVGEQNTFKALVDEFQKAGYLSTRQAGSLDSILQAGHAAVHRGFEPTEADIATLLDITEAIVETAYLHEARTQALDARVPKRKRPK